MKLKDKLKPSTPPLEAGMYLAVCTMVIDIGQQYNERSKKVENKLMFVFDIPDEKIDTGKGMAPRQLSLKCNYTAHENGKYTKLLCSWLNRKFTKDEVKNFEAFDLIGLGCQLLLIVSDDKEHNWVEKVMPLRSGMKTPTSSNPSYTYDIDEDGFSGEKWNSLPEWVRGIVEKSEQYQRNPPAQPLEMPEDEAPPEPPQTPEPDEEDCPI